MSFFSFLRLYVAHQRFKAMPSSQSLSSALRSMEFLYRRHINVIHDYDYNHIMPITYISYRLAHNRGVTALTALEVSYKDTNGMLGWHFNFNGWTIQWRWINFPFLLQTWLNTWIHKSYHSYNIISCHIAVCSSHIMCRVPGFRLQELPKWMSPLLPLLFAQCTHRQNSEFRARCCYRQYRCSRYQPCWLHLM